MTIVMTDLQEALSPVPLPAWATRWTRAATRAATISNEESVVLTETNRFGIVVWQAPAPDRTDRDQIGDVQFVGQWIAEPRLSALGRQFQKLQLAALFAPDRSFGSCGQHPAGQMLSVVAGAVAGAAVGAYSLGGPTALISGLVVGAVIGFAGFLALAITARRHLHGPIAAPDVDLLDITIALARVNDPCMTVRDAPLTAVAHRLAWELTNSSNSAAEDCRLRYQSRMLAQACSDVRRAEQSLTTMTCTPTGSKERVGVSRVADEAAEIIETLQFRSVGLGQVTERLRGVRSPGTGG